MANSEHLKILEGGVQAWNDWRSREFRKKELEVTETLPDLSEADLSRRDLSWANLWNVDLQQTNLRDANLSFANLGSAMLFGTCLAGATLYEATLVGALLAEADLRRADLSRSNLAGTNVNGVDFAGAKLARTCLAHIDLSTAIGLTKVRHGGPSTVGTDTLALSSGRIPADFLKGCGLSDWEILSTKLYRPDRSADEIIDLQNEVFSLRTSAPIQINPLFLSYSHADTRFVNALEPRLDEKGIRFWRDVHDLKAGRVETQLDRAIRLNPTFLLVLSENSVNSDWVEWEAAKARELEKDIGRDVLCPVALDDAWKNCAWPGPLRRQIQDYHILDFSGWQDDGYLERQFERLVDGLGLFYQPKTQKSNGDPEGQLA